MCIRDSLSYRSQLAGWKFKYLPEVECPSELPIEMTAFKTCLLYTSMYLRGRGNHRRAQLGSAIRCSTLPKPPTLQRIPLDLDAIPSHAAAQSHHIGRCELCQTAQNGQLRP